MSTVQLKSPIGVVVRVSEHKAQTLLTQGYVDLNKTVEPPEEKPRRRATRKVPNGVRDGE